MLFHCRLKRRSRLLLRKQLRRRSSRQNGRPQLLNSLLPLSPRSQIGLRECRSPRCPSSSSPQVSVGDVCGQRGARCSGWEELGCTQRCCLCNCRGLERPACHRGLVSSSHSPGYGVGWHCHGVVLASVPLYCERIKAGLTHALLGAAFLNWLAGGMRG